MIIGKNKYMEEDVLFNDVNLVGGPRLIREMFLVPVSKKLLPFVIEDAYRKSFIPCRELIQDEEDPEWYKMLLILYKPGVYKA